MIDTIEQSGRVNIRDYIKRTAVPTRDTVVPAAPEEVPSDRTKGQVSQIFVILRLKSFMFNQLRSTCIRWYKLILFGKLSTPYC